MPDLTIHDIAEEAGVSIATISRVLNDVGQVKAETRAKVLEIVERRKFSLAPRSTRTRRSSSGKASPLNEARKKIVFLVPDHLEFAMQTPLTSRLLGGVGSIIQAKNIELSFLKLEGPNEIPNLILSGAADGVIVKNNFTNDPLRKALKRLPHVICMESQGPDPKADQVMPDVEALANDVLCHFLSKGMDEVLACGDLDEPPQQQRIEHLKRLGEKKGLKVSACDTLKGGKHYRGVIERMKSGKSTKFGVFVSDGHLSSAALCLEMARHQISLDENIELVAIEESYEDGSVIDPAICALDLNAEEVGKAAAETLLWRLENPQASPRRILIRSKLKPGK